MTTNEQVNKLRSIQDGLAECLRGEDNQAPPGYQEILLAMNSIGSAVVLTFTSQADYETRNP